MRLGGPRRIGRFRFFRCLLDLVIFSRLEGGDPVCRRRFEVVIENVEQNGIERSAFLCVGENHHAQVLVGHQHHARDKALHAAGVSDEFMSAIIAQAPSEGIIRKSGLQRRQ